MTSVVRTFTESPTSGDILSRTSGFTRNLTETNQTLDTMARQLAMTRRFTELPTQTPDIVSEDNIQPRKPHPGVWRLTNKETMP